MSLWQKIGLVVAGLIAIWAGYQAVRGLDMRIFDEDD